VKIVIDAGHGPETPGKRSPDGSLWEYQFNSAVARFLADELLHGYEGVEILFTHADDRDVPLKERTDRANAWGADLFVSIHANAYGDGGWNEAKGIETYVYTTRPAAALKLAEAVHRNLIRATGRPDRGVKTANFHVLRETKMPAILVECGFMTNRQEVAFLKCDEYRRKCATAIAGGIAEVYQLKRKSAVTNPPAADELPKITGSARVLVNGQDIGMGYLIDGRTYVPLRAIGDALGLQVEWDQSTKTASLKGGK
jgi:N-acetylmuramoyl-L-alanine amidase